MWLALLGCSDRDGDGLSGAHERRLGTDPDVADSDADRLSDGAELEVGSDPLNPDTDGDGYADGDELNEGTDPLDSDSRIYQGGWPFQHAKHTLPRGSLETGARPGDQFPEFIATDAFGDTVDLYDYALGGVPVLVQFCTPISIDLCRVVNEWLHRKDPHPPLETYDPVRDAVEDGRLRWVTVVTTLPEIDPVAHADVVEFDETYPGVLALPDAMGSLHIWATQDLTNNNIPLYILLREDLRIQRIDSDADPARGYTLYDLALSMASEEAD